MTESTSPDVQPVAPPAPEVVQQMIGRPVPRPAPPSQFVPNTPRVLEVEGDLADDATYRQVMASHVAAQTLSAQRSAPSGTRCLFAST